MGANGTSIPVADRMELMNYGPYSPIRQAQDTYYVSGQVGIAPGTTNAAEDIADQTRQVLTNLGNVLKSAGLGYQDVVKTTVFLADMNDFKIVNGIYEQFFEQQRPARSCVEVAGLPVIGNIRLLVEIEAVAFRGNQIKGSQNGSNKNSSEGAPA